MKIGMILSNVAAPMDSISHQFRSTVEALRQEHELIFRPPDFAFYSRERQKEILKEMILSCDVLLGWMDDSILQARQEIDKQVPYICYLLGCLPRGNVIMRRNYHLWRTTDVLLVNCTGDLEIAHNFFENAQVRLLPYAYSESDFYPMDEASKQALRAKLGFDSEDKILFYSGRLTLEKNVHSILKIFSVVQNLIPNAHLIIAGRGYNNPFFEFSTCSLNIRGTLEKVVAKLGIDKDKVKFVGQKDAASLRKLYNIADAVVNMTLHHDENFGMSQIEAMACGTPVIGANWGGLKDTIEDGQTGYKVSTTVTASGVKLNWWEAVNKIVSLFQNDSEYLRLRQKCLSIASTKYSQSRYVQNLQDILVDCLKKAETGSEPLRISEFAQQYWNSCVPVWGEIVAYKNGVSPYHMYKQLITPYTGTSRNGAADDRQIKANHVVCLAAPLVQAGEETLDVDDPIFPLRVTIPEEYKEVVSTVIKAMKEEPAITVERLTNNYLDRRANVSDALEWMIETGLLLKNEPEIGAVSTGSIGSQMSAPLFSFQNLHASTDVVVFR